MPNKRTAPVNVLVTARLGSSRLAAKHLRPMHGDRPSLACLLDRLKGQSAPLVLCLPVGEEEQPLRDIATEAHIACFSGDGDNVLRRYAQALDWLATPAAIIVDADDVFVSVEAVAGIAAAYDGHDVVTCSGLPYGGAPCLLSRAFLGRMLETGTTSTGWSRFLEQLPGRKLDLPDWGVGAAEQTYRLSLDYDEDLAFLRYLYANAGALPDCRLADVLRYVTAHRKTLSERFPALFDGSLEHRARNHLG